MLDYRIETFLTVCETMNFTAAAGKLHITQPAVSQHIKSLEKELGIPLFLFQGRRFQLTAGGQRLRQMATAMQNDIEHFKEISTHEQQHRRINFGATLTIAEYIMPDPLAALLESHPQTNLRMFVGNTGELLHMMDQGELDFAVIEGNYDRRNYDGIPYKTERFIPVIAAGRIAGSGESTADAGIDAGELFGQAVFVREEGSGTREIMDLALQEHNISLADFANCIEIGNLNTIKSLVCRGLGISFFYESVVERELQEQRLAEIPLRNFDVRHDFTFLWKRGSFFEADYRKIYELLKGEDV